MDVRPSTPIDDFASRNRDRRKGGEGVNSKAVAPFCIVVPFFRPCLLRVDGSKNSKVT